MTCCGKSFCRACINKVKSGSDVVSCPCCNHTKIVDFPDVRLQQTLYGLRVYCTNREQGCEWSGELRELDNHLNRPAKFNDSSTDSQKPGQRSGIPAAHSCPYVLIRCTKCNEVVKRIELEDHNLTECLQAEPVQDILSNESHDLTECLQIEPLQNRINQCNHEVSQFAGSRLKCPAVSQNHMITGLMILLAFFIGLSISLIQKSQNDGGVSMPLMKWEDEFKHDLFPYESTSSYNIAVAWVTFIVTVWITFMLLCCFMCACVCSLLSPLLVVAAILALFFSFCLSVLFG